MPRVFRWKLCASEDLRACSAEGTSTLCLWKQAQQDRDRAREHNPYQADRSRLPQKTKDKQFKLYKQTELIGQWSARPVQR